jgi:predicted ATPase
MNNSTTSLQVLSRSQRHFFCEAVSIPITDRPVTDVMADIARYVARCNLSDETVYDMISAMRRRAQSRADAINTSLFVERSANPLTGVHIIKHFNTFELTRIAYKLRISRVYCTRVFIAFEIADIAQAQALTMKGLDLILRTGVRHL